MVSRWYHPKDNLSGWSKSQKEATRHRHLLEEIRERARGRKPQHKSALSVYRALLGLANVTQDKRTKELARKDASWIKKTKSWSRK